MTMSQLQHKHQYHLLFTTTRQVTEAGAIGIAQVELEAIEAEAEIPPGGDRRSAVSPFLVRFTDAKKGKKKRQRKKLTVTLLLLLLLLCFPPMLCASSTPSTFIYCFYCCEFPYRLLFMYAMQKGSNVRK